MRLYNWDGKKLPTLTQRRLNSAIRQRYDKYDNWYDAAIKLRYEGYSLQDVVEFFDGMGFTMSKASLWGWLQEVKRGVRETDLPNPEEDDAYVY